MHGIPRHKGLSCWGTTSRQNFALHVNATLQSINRCLWLVSTLGTLGVFNSASCNAAFTDCSRWLPTKHTVKGNDILSSLVHFSHV
jgi:hypothetical protein